MTGRGSELYWSQEQMKDSRGQSHFDSILADIAGMVAAMTESEPGVVSERA